MYDQYAAAAVVFSTIAVAVATRADAGLLQSSSGRVRLKVSA